MSGLLRFKMAEITGMLVFVGCLSLSFAAVCEDVDTKACELMAHKHQHLCNDTCMSHMCQRFCGNCPVKCYECHEIDNPANCTNLVTCPSKDHYCYTTQTFADDFSEVYKMGCAMKDLCNQYLGPENRKKNIDVNGACCTDDKCNNKLPLVLITEEQLPKPTLTGTPVNLTADPNACINRDDTACKLFETAKRNVCSNTCFATNFCPRMCGQCFNCYSCNDIDKVNDCNATNFCHAGSECFTLETLSLDLKPVYRVGCLEEQLCAKFKASSQTIFGRRDGFALKGGCCKTDLCNDHIETYHQPTTQAPVQTTARCQHNKRHCPHGYALINRSCYMIGTQTVSWYEAKRYCSSHCGRLADFSDKNEMADVFSGLVPHHGKSYTDTRIWTDATYTSGHWTWSHNHQNIRSHDFDSLTSTHTSGTHCGFAYVHSYYNHDGAHVREKLESAACSHNYLPLCEATYSHIG